MVEVNDEVGAQAAKDTFSFGRALEELRSGKKLARTGWNGAKR